MNGPARQSSIDGHYQLSPAPTAVSQPCMTEKCVDGFQGVFLHEDIELSSIEKTRERHRKTFLKNQKGCFKRCYCTCLPRWVQYAVWTIILALLLIIIVLGSIFATFKMPTFDLIGLMGATNADSSSLTVNNGKFSYHFLLQVNVNNPNIFPLHFSKMNATAFYPSDTTPNSKIPIGGGYLSSQWVPAKTSLLFMYPFQIDYDPSLDTDQSVLSSLTDKCGLTGNQPQDLSIDYTIQLTASALFIVLQPVISSSAQFPCPIEPEMLQQDENSAFTQDSISDSMLSMLK